MDKYAVTLTNQHGTFTYIVKAKNKREAIMNTILVQFPDGNINNIQITPIVKSK